MRGNFSLWLIIVRNSAGYANYNSRLSLTSFDESERDILLVVPLLCVYCYRRDRAILQARSLYRAIFLKYRRQTSY